MTEDWVMKTGCDTGIQPEGNEPKMGELEDIETLIRAVCDELSRLAVFFGPAITAPQPREHLLNLQNLITFLQAQDAKTLAFMQAHPRVGSIFETLGTALIEASADAATAEATSLLGPGAALVAPVISKAAAAAEGAISASAQAQAGATAPVAAPAAVPADGQRVTAAGRVVPAT